MVSYYGPKFNGGNMEKRKIRTWLDNKGFTVADLARMINEKPPTVYTWVNGVVVGERRHFPIPGLIALKKIHKLTKGKVSYNDWD